MLATLGLTLGLILIMAAVHSELRSASYGVTLSNGVEVLVGPEMYREIVKRYRSLEEHEPDDWTRWDRAILEVLRFERPNEWKFLARSLGHQVVGEGAGARRRARTVNHR
jgi:hypothetical protein